MRNSMLASLVFSLLAQAETMPPKPFTKVASVEGVSEYRLPNGLRLLLVPDESVSKVTVNLTVLVGSRHEGYGEKGMAHLLEHMLFKGSTKYPDPKKEMGARGANWNGTTREDRTNYFETLPASDANLEFAMRLEADRLVNSFVNKSDLDTEMTVVRNEFERSENNAPRVLSSRVRAAALPWHNYGRSVIGIKADIELVPIDNLKAFYKRYYQPDNTVVVIAGKFNEAKAFVLAAETFGKIPRPARVLPNTFTTEPVQDGERAVTVRRVGGIPALNVAWRIPGSTDPDYPALMVLQGVLGDRPQGRLHQTLVEGKKAATAGCGLDDLKEPGLFSCDVAIKPGDDVAAARDLLFATIETPKALTPAEVTRSATGWISQWEQTLQSAEGVGLFLSEWAAVGDWRLLYVQRDRMKKMTPDDVLRVWTRYLKPQNRTSGEYIPTPKPDRAEISAMPEIGPIVNGYVGGPPVAKGEAFDPSPKNIDARTRSVTLPNGAKLALLPKKTRAESVKMSIALRMGNETTLSGQIPASTAAAQMLNRGTKKLPFKEFRSELERLRAQISVSGSGQTAFINVEAQRPQLAEVLALLNDVLKTPAFDAKEFEIARSEQLAGLERAKMEPTVLGPTELKRALAPFGKDHPLFTPTFEQRIASAKAVTADQAKAFYSRFYGAQNASIAVVGDFDDKEVEKSLTAMLGSWSSKEPYALVKDAYVAAPANAITLPTPDKQNAWMGYGTNAKLNDSAAEYPAMVLATSMLGGSPSARLFESLREKKGLSYGAYSFLDVDSENDRAEIQTSVIYAPQNVSKVEQGLQEEFERWASISNSDLEATRSEVLNDRLQNRADDARLVQLLVQHGLDGRNMGWEEALEAKYKALTPAQLSEAVKKMVDPKNLVKVKAGDFKSIAVPK
jgi:zinc protease